MSKPQAWRNVERRTADALEERHGGQPLPSGGRHVGAGDDVDHARGAARLRGVDAADLGVGAIAAQEIGRRLFVHGDVGGVAAVTGDEANVFASAGEFLIGQVSLRYVSVKLPIGGRQGSNLGAAAQAFQPSFRALVILDCRGAASSDSIVPALGYGFRPRGLSPAPRNDKFTPSAAESPRSRWSCRARPRRSPRRPPAPARESPEAAAAGRLCGPGRASDERP